MKEEECQLRQCMSKDDICRMINAKALGSTNEITSSSPSTSTNLSTISNPSTSPSPVKKTPYKLPVSDLNIAPIKCRKKGIQSGSVESFQKRFSKPIAPSPIRGTIQEIPILYDDIDELYDELNHSDLNWRQLDLNINQSFTDSLTLIQNDATESPSISSNKKNRKLKYEQFNNLYKKRISNIPTF